MIPLDNSYARLHNHCEEFIQSPGSVDTILSAPWVYIPEWKTMELFVPDQQEVMLHAWIKRRNWYCDRGHFELEIEGPLVNCWNPIDASDSFPRYYMDGEIAKREAKNFIIWRLFKKDIGSVRTVEELADTVFVPGDEIKTP